ncbi:gibberellin-regulated protein 5-like [Zingiber officinale]|uniref:Uncharacterized protein n=1 Tax=Zingiber officinale TaxID=94328 RepID=A0A8J5CDF1_ZINOF|nr:gibberellin-regulated protein 5-like [Zingiber officinale]KAG6473214.1 hypothetical protein ZIOFF_067127 [Zingiber officinale]
MAAAARSSSIFLSCPLLLALLLASSLTESVSGGQLQPRECQGKCAYRCSATSHKKPCMFFCLKCCAKCLCVPPGTYGNKETCACYNNWKTQEGRPKCP